MKAETEDVRKILSNNIKRYRKRLRFSQEKLAEAAGLSVQMVNDIEGCRKWVSDKTITRLSGALQTEVFQLLLPGNEDMKENNTSIARVVLDLKQELKAKIDSQIDREFDGILKSSALVHTTLPEDY
jgi:transcriptional regulator with XRE-family HTH domain